MKLAGNIIHGFVIHDHQPGIYDRIREAKVRSAVR